MHGLAAVRKNLGLAIYFPNDITCWHFGKHVKTPEETWHRILTIDRVLDGSDDRLAYATAEVEKGTWKNWERREKRIKRRMRELEMRLA